MSGYSSSLISFGLLVAGIAFLATEPVPIIPEAIWNVVGIMLAAIGGFALMARTNDRGRSPAFLRLDHFLPFLRKKWQIRGRPNALVRAVHLILPNSLFFDPITGSEGALRRMLRKMGMTVLSSPIRRLAQALFFAAFLWSFFHMCWPYSATPVSEGLVHSGLHFAEIEQESGQLKFLAGPIILEALLPGQVWHLAESSNREGENASVGSFKIAATEDRGIWLEAAHLLTADQLDAVLLGSGPWSLHETEPGMWPSHYADELRRKEIFPADSFLILDPLVSLSTALAARSWVWSLASAGVILIVCFLIPRGFCGYVCPLGTLIDLFDWSLGRRWKRFRISGEGWWVHIKYYLLAGTLIAAISGILVSGYVAAIPVLTRAMLFIGEPLQSGFARGWHLIPPMNVGHAVSVALFLSVLLIGLLRPRFWCKYICPSGAVFSLANLFRVSERKVEASCIHCNKCVPACPFDAIKPDFTTRVTDCTLCQTCAGVCPTHSIKFVERWNTFDLKKVNQPATGETGLGRRGFMGLIGGVTASVAGGVGLSAASQLWGAGLGETGSFRPVRPPGSVREQDFLQLCIRCGECFKVCPNNVLQSLGFEQGLEGLWTPHVKADWAGCESSCNACGQVCPTGAIRELPMMEKRFVRMGLAVVDEVTCLPFAEREACQLCVDECIAAGYDAIEFTRVGTELGPNGNPVEGSGYLAPVVVPERCVGCGLCQTRCYGINVEEKKVLRKSAIIIEAGPGKEDRLKEGSYTALRRAERREQDEAMNLIFDEGADPFNSTPNP